MYHQQQKESSNFVIGRLIQWTDFLDITTALTARKMEMSNMISKGYICSSVLKILLIYWQQELYWQHGSAQGHQMKMQEHLASAWTWTTNYKQLIATQQTIPEKLFLAKRNGNIDIQSLRKLLQTCHLSHFF